MTFYDDPNREAVGLPPIWTSATQTPAEGELPGDPGAFTIAVVQAWVDAHPHAAADVLAHERARGASARSTLVEWLEGFVESHDGVDPV